MRTTRSGRGDGTGSAALPVPREFDDGPAAAAAGPSGETAAPPLAAGAPFAALASASSAPLLVMMPWLFPMVWSLQAASLTAVAWQRALSMTAVPLPGMTAMAPPRIP